MHLFTQASDLRSILQSEPSFAESFADSEGQLLSQQLDLPNIKEPYSLHLMRRVSYYPYGSFKGLRLCVNWAYFLAITQATNQNWGWL